MLNYNRKSKNMASINLDKYRAYWEEFKEAARDTFADWPSRILGAVAVAANVLCWWLAFNARSAVSGEIAILHYNVDFGIDLIGSPAKIYILPVAGLFFILLNFILFFPFKPKDKTVGYLLLAAALIANLFLLTNLQLVKLVNLR